MGSGRGDRNQLRSQLGRDVKELLLQWGPVVVTGIRVVFGEVDSLSICP